MRQASYEYTPNVRDALDKSAQASDYPSIRVDRRVTLPAKGDHGFAEPGNYQELRQAISIPSIATSSMKSISSGVMQNGGMK